MDNLAIEEKDISRLHDHRMDGCAIRDWDSHIRKGTSRIGFDCTQKRPVLAARNYMEAAIFLITGI